MGPLELVRLTALMERTSGRADVSIGLIDGPVAVGHPHLEGANIREIHGGASGGCAVTGSAACMHGTLVAGVLLGRKDSPAPAICPGCTLLVRPIFAETTSGGEEMPSATPAELAGAIIDCVNAGARVVNLSAALVQTTGRGEQEVGEALDHAARRGVMVVAAAGNQGAIGSSAVTRHPWVIPVVACDLQGRPIQLSNLSNSIGKHGLSAPGVGIASLGVEGGTRTFGGTSAAAPFVTGAAALLWSLFPAAKSAPMQMAITRAGGARRSSLVPPLLDAWEAYRTLSTGQGAR